MSDNKKALVIGASGFLGGHLVRELNKQGYDVRILVRATSDISPIKDEAFEKFIGDVGNQASMEKAMEGCEYVFHSAVNTGAWLVDSGPLYETNVMGVYNAINAAEKVGVEKFVLTSSLVTIGRNASGVSTEEDYPVEKDFITEYSKTRYYAEKIMLDAAKERGFPAVSCCVSNTYGAFDCLPTPHGNLVKQVALGRVPVYLDASAECVGVVDAAQGLILAAEKGKIGERYIISDKYISNKEIFETAAKKVGVAAPRWVFPRPLLTVITHLIESVCRLVNIDSVLTNKAMKMLYETWPFNNEKAKKDLGWKPRPVEESIEEAAVYYKKDL